jgi:hypothetical protein
MFEKTADIAAVSADGETSRPLIRSGIVGELRETIGLFGQSVEYFGGVLVVVVRGCGIDQILPDGRERRFVECQRLFDTEDVQRGDVSAVRCVFERRPHLGSGSLTEFAAGAEK